MTCSTPSDYGILTYVVPWVPADLDVDRTHLISRAFWRNTVPGVTLTARIDFVVTFSDFLDVMSAAYVDSRKLKCFSFNVSSASNSDRQSP
jgi:hypothetical protein